MPHHHLVNKRKPPETKCPESRVLKNSDKYIVTLCKRIIERDSEIDRLCTLNDKKEKEIKNLKSLLGYSNAR